MLNMLSEQVVETFPKIGTKLSLLSPSGLLWYLQYWPFPCRKFLLIDLFLVYYNHKLFFFSRNPRVHMNWSVYFCVKFELLFSEESNKCTYTSQILIETQIELEFSPLMGGTPSLGCPWPPAWHCLNIIIIFMVTIIFEDRIVDNVDNNFHSKDNFFHCGRCVVPDCSRLNLNWNMIDLALLEHRNDGGG